MESITQDPPASDGSTGRDLSDEVVALVTKLIQAIQKHQMYPPAHPALEPSIVAALEGFADVFRDTTSLSFGVAARQLMVDGVASDPKQSRFSTLAGRLHRHQLAALTFRDGISQAELSEFLALVAVEAELAEQPLGRRGDDLPEWEHIDLVPIRYERLSLVDEAGSITSGLQATELWLGLARAAGWEVSDGGALDDASTENMARSIERYSANRAYAEQVLEQLVEIAEELSFATGGEAEDLRDRISEVISLTDPNALRNVLASGDAGRRQALVEAATPWLDPVSLIRVVLAAAAADEHELSEPLIRMLSKLAQHTENGAPDVRAVALKQFREHVSSLSKEALGERPEPEEYARALESLTRPMTGGDEGQELELVRPERLVRMAVEIEETGPSIWKAVGNLMTNEGLAELLRILAEAPANSAVVETLWERIETPEAIERILEDPNPDFETLDQILARMGTAAAPPMLETLSSSESRSVRRGIYSRIKSMGTAVGLAVAERLDDERWFVVRNMLALMGELEEWPPGWSPADYKEHSHASVRREALKLMLREPEHRRAAVLELLADDEPRSRALGLAAAVESLPPDAVALVTEMAADRTVRGDVRVMAVRALGQGRDDRATDALVRLVGGDASWLARLFRRRRLTEKSRVMLAALEELRSSGTERSKVRRVLSWARRSRDAEIRSAAGAGEAA